jgi:uncharacterized membrane protein YoaK (UPF0700 family)
VSFRCVSARRLRGWIGLALGGAPLAAHAHGGPELFFALAISCAVIGAVLGALAGWRRWRPLWPPAVLLLVFLALFALPSLVSGTFTGRTLRGSVAFTAFAFVASMAGYLPTWWGMRRARERRALRVNH